MSGGMLKFELHQPQLLIGPDHQILIRIGFQGIHKVRDQRGYRGTYNIAAVFGITGMSEHPESFHCLICSSPVNRYTNHNRLSDRLSIDLFDLNLCVLLSVTVFLVISRFSLVLVNDNLFGLTVCNH